MTGSQNFTLYLSNRSQGVAASGIGKGVALAFAEAGVAGVVVADVNEHGAQSTAEELGQYATHNRFRAIAVKVDIVDEASVQDMVDTAKKEFGRIDYSVNSAGLGNLSGALTPNLKLDVFSKTIDVNIKGTLYCVRAVSKAMADQEPSTHSDRHGDRELGRGSIVNLGSVNSYTAAPGMLPYTTSKHALMGLTKSAALDCLQNRIRINAVCPSWVDTPMMQASLQRVPMLGEIIGKVSPLQRAASVPEVADYIIFLCSPSASYINGTGLTMDAGATLTTPNPRM
ncbi:MAG: hypothetical protein Q9162_001360 [Coniocarpon cinnabarinum]